MGGEKLHFSLKDERGVRVEATYGDLVWQMSGTKPSSVGILVEPKAYHDYLKAKGITDFDFDAWSEGHGCHWYIKFPDGIVPINQVDIVKTSRPAVESRLRARIDDATAQLGFLERMDEQPVGEGS